MTPWITKPVPFNIGQGAAAAEAGCFFTSDFTEDNWDDLGNQSANGGDDYSSTSIVSDKLRMNCNSGAGTFAGAVAIRQLSAALGTSWNIRFNYTTGSSFTSAPNAYLWVGVTSDSTYTSSQGADSQSGDACFWRWQMTDTDELLVNKTWDGGAETSTSNGQTGLSWANNTTEYWELTYDDTTFSSKKFTDSSYDTQDGTTTTVTDAGLTGMNYLLVGTGYDAVSGVWAIDINDIKINNDSTDPC